MSSPSLKIVYETSLGAGTTVVSLRGNNIQPEVYHFWFKDRFAAWLRAGWNPRVHSQPAQLVSGEWCTIVDLDGKLKLDQLYLQEIRRIEQ